MFQVYIGTPSGFESTCYTKFGRAFKHARKALAKARIVGGHIQIGSRVVWAAGSGWAVDVASKLAQEASHESRRVRRVA